MKSEIIASTAIIAFTFFLLANVALAGPMSFKSDRHGQHGVLTWTVSSVKAAHDKQNFGPKHFYFGDGAWCEGARGSGRGQWVRLEYQTPKTFQSIILLNGNAQNKKTFKQFNRIKKAKLELSNGKSFKLNLKDSPAEQKIELPKLQRAKWAKLTIVSIYRGKNIMPRV